MNQITRKQFLEEYLNILQIGHSEYILKESTLKDAHIYCIVNKLSPQQYGPLIERFIMRKFNYNKNSPSHCNGDLSKNGNHYEIKVSFGGKKQKYNFVQIRPKHDCVAYILTAYNISSENIENEGELYIFRIPKNEMKRIIIEFGGYAHGTIRENGIITIENLHYEYAIRTSINDLCWKQLLPFRISESIL